MKLYTHILLPSESETTSLLSEVFEKAFNHKDSKGDSAAAATRVASQLFDKLFDNEKNVSHELLRDLVPYLQEELSNRIQADQHTHPNEESHLRPG